MTGWIPERVSIKSSSNEFDADREFRRLEKRFHQGHCLVTVATGVLTPDVEERSGLVPTHAYALLDLRQVDVRGVYYYQFMANSIYLRIILCCLAVDHMETFC